MGWKTFLFGLAALLSLSEIGSVLIVIGMISVIGIPIALLITALPGLFLIYFLSRLIFLLFAKPRSAVHGGMALGLALMILAVPPVLVNSWLDKKADALIAQDIDDATGIPKVASLAVVAARGNYKGGQCDELCKRLLLNGQVDEFIMWREAEPFDEAKLPQTGQRFRFVRQASCKAPEGLISGDSLGLAKDDEGMKGRSLDDLIGPILQQAIAWLATQCHFRGLMPS